MSLMMSEILPVPFAPGYFVSDDGRVFSEKCGKRKELRQSPQHGYRRVTLSIDGSAKYKYVHALVATAFIGPCPSPGFEVRHNDGTRDNNRVSNLLWGSRSDNMHDAVRHGRNPQQLYPERAARGDRSGPKLYPDRYPRGSRCHAAKLNESDVELIRSMSSAGSPSRELAAEFGVSTGNVGSIVRGASWRHVGGVDVAREPQNYGKNHPWAKLVEAQVRDIRMRHASGERRKDIANAFGISAPNVSHIVNKTSWAHVADIV